MIANKWLLMNLTNKWGRHRIFYILFGNELRCGRYFEVPSEIVVRGDYDGENEEIVIAPEGPYGEVVGYQTGDQLIVDGNVMAPGLMNNPEVGPRKTYDFDPGLEAEIAAAEVIGAEDGEFIDPMMIDTAYINQMPISPLQVDHSPNYSNSELEGLEIAEAET